jgi:signal transduction histidine kinase
MLAVRMPPQPEPATAAEQKALAAEKRIAWVRLTVITFNVVAYYGLLPNGQGVPALAAAVSVVAMAYGLVVVAWQPYRWLPIMRAALFTALTDGGLIVLWVWATGGFASPFHLLWFLSLVAVSFRYEWKATLFAAVLYIASYLMLLAALGDLAGNGVEILVRCVYIALAGTLGSLLAHDSAEVFQARARLQADLVEERRRAEANELDRLRDLDRFKSDFINAAAHELNTPLTPLRMQVHLMGKQQDAVAHRKSLGVVQRSVDRLASLVQTMLDVARLQSGRMTLRVRPSNVADLMRAAVDTYRPVARQKDVQLQADLPADLQASVDQDRVAQILDNLISNAIKFTPPGGRVTCTASAEPHGVRLVVEDTGLGFDQAQASVLFKPFSRLHMDVMNEPGTGLGLFVSQGLAERHGGRLEAYSAGSGRGARFTCELPLAPPSDP